MIRAGVNCCELDVAHVQKAPHDLSDAAETGDDDWRARVVDAVERRRLIVSRQTSVQ